MMNSSILLYGLVQRSLPHTIASLRECIIEPLKAHGPVSIYYHSWDTMYLENSRTRESTYIDPSDIAHFLPEAIGRVDSEEDFDADVDWDSLYRSNRTEHKTDTPSGILTFKNIIRTLESLERAWNLFCDHRIPQNGPIVVSRADLRYLRPLSHEDISANGVAIPTFHGWGGLNDRFALGSPTTLRVYCRRRQFFEDQLPNKALRNPESVLQAWLELNGVQVKGINFPFQRVRADGSIWHKDEAVGFPSELPPSAT
jgi:hypothetical protein